MPAPRILVVGSSNTDMIVKMDRIPRPGETIVGGDFLNAANSCMRARLSVSSAEKGSSISTIGRSS